MNEIIVNLPITIRECLKKISANGEGIVFLQKDFKLFGSLTDGDIRRALIAGVSLDESVEIIANRNVKSLNKTSSAVDIHKAFTPGVNKIPIVNLDGFITNIINRNDKTLITLAEPNLGPTESEFLNDALKSGWISSAGSYVDRFENEFADYVKSENALAVSNGTMGLVLALSMLDIGVGDEVILPNITFGATANAVRQVGAKPVFVDICPDTLCINTNLISSAITNNTKAIMPVHLYGNAAEMSKLLEIARQFDLYVVEDSAEALGTKILEQHVGTFGDIGVFSFYANKLITTGEGGMVIFKDHNLLSKGKMIRSHGFSPNNRYWHEILGTNMRLTNLQASIGCAQLQRIDEFLIAKQNNAQLYKELLAHLCPDFVRFSVERPGVTNSNWLFIIKLTNKKDTLGLANYLLDNQIETRRVFYPLNIQPAFKEYVTEGFQYQDSMDAFDSWLCLPSSTLLQVEQLQKITYFISRYFKKYSI